MDAAANIEAKANANAAEQDVEACPSFEDVVRSQFEDIARRFAELDALMRTPNVVGRGLGGDEHAYRMREVALHSALAHHRTDQTTACQDATIVTSAAAFYAWLAGEPAK